MSKRARVCGFARAQKDNEKGLARKKRRLQFGMLVSDGVSRMMDVDKSEPMAKTPTPAAC